MTTPPLGLHNVCTFQFCCRWGDWDFESGPACLIQVTDQLITAWGVRDSYRRQGRGHPAREKKLVPSVLLNINRLLLISLGLVYNLPAIYLSPLVQTCLDRSQDISSDSFKIQQSFNSLERNQSLGFWEGQETLYPSINTNIQMIFYSSQTFHKITCVWSD